MYQFLIPPMRGRIAPPKQGLSLSRSRLSRPPKLKPVSRLRTYHDRVMGHAIALRCLGLLSSNIQSNRNSPHMQTRPHHIFYIHRLACRTSKPGLPISLLIIQGSTKQENERIVHEYYALVPEAEWKSPSCLRTVEFWGSSQTPPAVPYSGCI